MGNILLAALSILLVAAQTMSTSDFAWVGAVSSVCLEQKERGVCAGPCAAAASSCALETLGEGRRVAAADLSPEAQGDEDAKEPLGHNLLRIQLWAFPDQTMWVYENSGTGCKILIPPDVTFLLFLEFTSIQNRYFLKFMLHTLKVKGPNRKASVLLKIYLEINHYILGNKSLHKLHAF